jgi:homoserine O-acetyltransferase
MVRINRLICLVVYLLAAPGILTAQTELRIADLGTCEIESGDVIRDCKAGYRTFGTLNDERSNAVLFPTWVTGTSADLVDLIGPGKLVDSSRYFVIAVDAFGNGVSSSPSNSTSQPGAKFPRVSIRDMVSAQYRLARETLGLPHLHAVVGISMGGMQALEWSVAYPAFVSKAVSIVGSPWLTGYDLLLWNTLARIIEQCQRAGCENTAGLVQLVRMVTGFTPQERVRRMPRERAFEMMKAAEESARADYQLDDALLQFRAMLNHDVTRRFGGSLERTAAIVQADAFILNATQDHSLRPESAKRFGELIRAEVYESTSDCGHAILVCEMVPLGQRISAFLDRPKKSR